MLLCLWVHVVFLPHGNRFHQCFCLPLYRVIHIPITYPQHLLPLASPAHTCKHIVNSKDAHPSNIKDQLEKHTQNHMQYTAIYKVQFMHEDKEKQRLPQKPLKKMEYMTILLILSEWLTQ